jgi:L-cysteate sulfo-lyase
MVDWLEAIPRVELVHAPTPLEPLDRFSAVLGGPRLWIKRDDCTGLATGGNKTRKLEYLIADALEKEADTVITFGAIQSNHARQTAAACARFGLECHLVLSRTVDWDHPDYETAGNVLLDDILGAHLHPCAPADTATVAKALHDELTQAGRRTYQIPPGGSNATGALGYVRCARELITQARDLDMTPELIVHATSSGGTQAGLSVGMAEAADNCRVLGINVFDPDGKVMEQRVARLVDALCALAPTLDARSVDLHFDHTYLGEGYGRPTPETIAGIRALAETEGIVTDPVYSGKALGGLLTGIREGRIEGTGDVVFVHTGGVAVQSVYGRAFARPTVGKV